MPPMASFLVINLHLTLRNIGLGPGLVGDMDIWTQSYKQVKAHFSMLYCHDE